MTWAPNCPLARPHFSLLASFSDPAAPSSLEPGHLWLTTLMGATWDFPGKAWAGEPLKQARWAWGGGSSEHAPWEHPWAVSGRKVRLEEGVCGSSRGPRAGGVVTRRPGRGRGSSWTETRYEGSPGGRRKPVLPRDSSEPTAPRVSKLSSLGTGLLHWRGESQGNWMSLPSPQPPHLMPEIILITNKAFYFHT